MICGTFSALVMSAMGSDTELQVDPMMRCTLCWWMKRLTLATPLSGLHSSSRRITSTLWPLMPPVALTASSWSLLMLPYLMPFSTSMRSVMPMRMVLSCAAAGAAPAVRTSSAGAAATTLS